MIEDAEIEKFRSELESIRILKWEKEYFAPVLDGTSWSVTIKTADGNLKVEVPMLSQEIGIDFVVS